MDRFLSFATSVLPTALLAILSALYMYISLVGKSLMSFSHLTLKQRVFATSAKIATRNLPIWVVRKQFVLYGYADRLLFGTWGKDFNRQWCRSLRTFDAGEKAPWGAYLIAEDAAGSEVGENADAVLLYAHGGGFCVGDALVSFPVFVKWINAWKVAHNANVHIVSLEYGLSPKHAHPDQRNAYVECYQWLVKEKSINPSKIFFAGDSAGGNLSIVSALHILHNPHLGLPLPAGILAISPPVNARATSESWTKHLYDDALGLNFHLWAVKQYDPNSVGEPGIDPEISPLFDRHLKGMPRMWTCIGQYEVLKDDLLEFVSLAKAAGVDATVVVEENQIHDYAVIWAIAEHGAQYKAMKQMGTFMFGEKAVDRLLQ